MSAEVEEGRRRLARLLEDGERDISALDDHASEVASAVGGSRSTLPDDARAAVLAVHLHAYYGAVESLLSRVAQTFDGGVPAGAEWHRELLDWMSRPLTDVRPAVMSPGSTKVLRSLLAFRHFFRHAYAVSLDLVELMRHATHVQDAHAQIAQDLATFLGHVRAIRDALG